MPEKITVEVRCHVTDPARSRDLARARIAESPRDRTIDGGLDGPIGAPAVGAPAYDAPASPSIGRRLEDFSAFRVEPINGSDRAFSPSDKLEM